MSVDRIVAYQNYNTVDENRRSKLVRLVSGIGLPKPTTASQHKHKSQPPRTRIGCMTDQPPQDARKAFERHDAFEAIDEATFDVTTTPFAVEATAAPAKQDGRDAQFVVTVSVPTIDAATEEDVGDAVADGWLDTLERRLEDAYDAPDVDPVAKPAIESDGETVEATFQFREWTARNGADDAKAVVDYVEGTYVQGVIPGYTYTDPVRSLLARARAHGGDDADGAAHGGTPL